MRRVVIAVVVGIVLAANGPVRGMDDELHDSEPGPAASLGWGMAAIGTNLGYIPAKMLYALGGGLVGLMAWGLGLGRKYYAMVVAVNWLSVPFAYAYAVLSLLLLFAPGLTGLLSLIWLALMIGLVFSISRIFRTICGPSPLMVATLTMVLIVPTMLLSDTLERFLGIYPG